jgi:hypothetical protein
MSIDALPPAPAATDPVDTFDAKAFAFNAALQLFRTQANATADTMQINADILAAVLLGMALPDYAGTSSSSFAIGIGSKVFATQTGKLWTVGQIVVISNGANLMRGPVTAYSAGNLTVNVTSISGSGTFSSWTIGLSFDGLLLAKSGDNVDITSLAGLTTALSVLQGGTGTKTGPVLRSYISGCTLSTAGGSNTMAIAAGQCTNSTNADLLSVVATSKTTSAWVVGSAVGGLDTGTIANSTWYYFYAIRRPDTGVVDVVFSLSSSAPTLPTNYTQFRYIGAGLTNGSGQWTKFTQAGDDFYWDTPVLDFSGAGITTASTLTLSVPRGRKVRSSLSMFVGANTVYLSDLANADLAPSQTVAPLGTLISDGAAGQITGISGVSIWTNTSAQIRHRSSNTAHGGSQPSPGLTCAERICDVRRPQ